MNRALPETGRLGTLVVMRVLVTRAYPLWRHHGVRAPERVDPRDKPVDDGTAEAAKTFKPAPYPARSLRRAPSAPRPTRQGR